MIGVKDTVAVNQGETVMTKQEAMLIPTGNLEYIMYESKQTFIRTRNLLDDTEYFRLLNLIGICKEELDRRNKHVKSC